MENKTNLKSESNFSVNNTKSQIIDDDVQPVNVKLISSGSALLAMFYQNTLINKNTPKMSTNKKLAWCFGAGCICYFMTNVILKNINQIN